MILVKSKSLLTMELSLFTIGETAMDTSETELMLVEFMQIEFMLDTASSLYINLKNT